MKILCILDSLGSGGAQRQLVGLAIEFKDRGHDVSFLTYHNLDFFYEMLHSSGIDVKIMIEPNYILRIFKFRKYIRNFGCDGIIAFLTGPSLIAELAGFPRRKWVLIVGERSANPIMLTSIRWRFYRWFHFLADYVVANSLENIRMVKEIHPKLKDERYRVIYNLVDLDKWKPSQDYIPFRNGKLNIVIASSHQYLKNLNGLIEGINNLSEEEKKIIHIDWYGAVQDESLSEGEHKIEEYKLSRIFKFLPATTRIQEIIDNCDVVALFSFYEGLPNTICEGMASGKVVIASNVSDNELLIENHELVFDPKRTDSITETLRRILKFSATDLIAIGRKNRIRAELLFDKKKVVNSYLDLLEKRNRE